MAKLFNKNSEPPKMSSAESVVAPLTESSEAAAPGTPNWSEMVARIQAGDPAGLEQLYRTFSRGLRYLLGRQLGEQDLDDKIHDIFVMVVKAIQQGGLREPERLAGFVRTIAQRKVAGDIESLVRTRKREVDVNPTMCIPDRKENPEAAALLREKADVVKRALAHLSDRNREILERFYLREQSAEQICSEMSLTATQFRLYKSRAKSEFGALGKKELSTPWHSRATAALHRCCA